MNDNNLKFNPPVPKGDCCICGHERIEIKQGYYACPGYYESPMHFCASVVIANMMFNGGKDYSKALERAKKEAIKRLEKYCGCTIDEYLKAVAKA